MIMWMRLALVSLSAVAFVAGAVGMVTGWLPLWAVLMAQTACFLSLLALVVSPRPSHKRKGQWVLEFEPDLLPGAWRGWKSTKVRKRGLVPLLRGVDAAADFLAAYRLRLRFYSGCLEATADVLGAAVNALIGRVQSLQRICPPSSEVQSTFDGMLQDLQHEDLARQHLANLGTVLRKEESDAEVLRGLLEALGRDLDRPERALRERFRAAVEPVLTVRTEKELLKQVTELGSLVADSRSKSGGGRR